MKPAALAAAAFAAAAITVTSAVLPASPASAVVLDKENFIDHVDSGPYDCVTDDGTVVHAADVGEVHVVITVTQRGNHVDAYFTESDHGTVTTTNLDTGRTLTATFANNFHDLSIIDNGDGTATIINKGAGGFKLRDDTGKIVKKDPGTVWSQFTVDMNGTPDDPFDDIFIEASFSIVKPSTGNSDFFGQNFCDDLLAFTS